MEEKEIKQLIRYHQTGLNQHRQHMNPSSEYLEEQTVNALKELLMLRELGPRKDFKHGPERIRDQQVR